MNIGMGMGTSVGLNVATGQRVEVKPKIQMIVKVQMFCQICGSEVLLAEKTGDLIWTCPFPCPAKIRACLEQYVDSRIVRHDCPECRKHNCVGINAKDFYECRLCHTQFTTCAMADWRRTYLIDEKKMDETFEAIIPVLVMPERGTGDFPKDEWLAKRLKRVRRCEQNLLKTLRALSRHLGSEDCVHFNGYHFDPDPAELAKTMLLKQGKILY